MLKVKRVQKGLYRASYQGKDVQLHHVTIGPVTGWYGQVVDAVLPTATKVVEGTMREAIWAMKLILIDITKSDYTVMDRQGRDVVAVHPASGHNLEAEAL